MERLRSGERIEVPLTSGGEYGFSIQVDAKAVWVHGCDCASSADVAEVQAVHEAMEAEAVPDTTLRRVVNRVLFGHPDGDDAEVIELCRRDDERRALFEGNFMAAPPEIQQLRAGDPLLVDGGVYRVDRVLADDSTQFRAQVRPDREESCHG